MTAAEDKKNPSVSKINALYNEGRIEQALLFANNLANQKPEYLKNAHFALLYAQILMEVDGPSSKIKSVLIHALNENPDNQQLLEYLEVAEAEAYLSHEKNDAGEVELANIIRRSPDNVHALFILGAHLFWIEKEPQRALKYLEQCVRLRPNFMRAKACLAAVYKTLNMKESVEKLVVDCVAKAKDESTKKFFRDFIER
jgi:predicted Zn-dependent protease